VGSTLPRTWVKVRQALENDQRNYIELQEYLDLCQEHGFKEHQDKLQLSGYLHDLGVCLHFQDDDLLKRTVILKPEWATAAVYMVLDNKRVINTLGRFTRKDLSGIWSGPEYADRQGELLQLMIKFKLCYEIPSSPGNFIAPQLLSENQPVYTWDETNNLILRYTYEFMPKGILTRFIVEMHRLREEAEATAVVQERQRLARDLHDSVTQSLYSLSLFSRAGREAADDGDMARLSRNLDEMERNTLHTLREMRLLLYELRPANLQQEGLVRALELRLHAVARRANVRVDAKMDDIPPLPMDAEVNLYYVVEEALNNIVKHTTASNVTLRLTRSGPDLRLHVTDDGQGFDPRRTSPGMGMRNIRERVARLKGHVVVRSRPGGGTRLEVTVPGILEDSHE
jgi:signal transduction histidine kinase